MQGLGRAAASRERKQAFMKWLYLKCVLVQPQHVYARALPTASLLPLDQSPAAGLAFVLAGLSAAGLSAAAGLLLEVTACWVAANLYTLRHLWFVEFSTPPSLSTCVHGNGPSSHPFVTFGGPIGLQAPARSRRACSNCQRAVGALTHDTYSYLALPPRESAHAGEARMSQAIQSSTLGREHACR